MEKKLHTTSDIVNALKDLESGIDEKTVRKTYGVTEAKLRDWQTKYKGLNEKIVHRMQKLEAENKSLKEMCKEMTEDNKILKKIISGEI